jgi:serine/threonine protein kinase/Tfp pilus assembly protein PilF
MASLGGCIIGRTLGHYRVLEQIGAGGMGIVYRARDERLERDIALKVLPPGTLADDSARKRFRKEALALSCLNHPNIATAYDFDTQEGIDFLVTELVPGITLDRKLVAGPLSEKVVVQIGLQMADGLEAAHHEGVIHRDLKPANLRLTAEGRLKILDFGLAKRFDEVAQETVTQSISEPGGAAGTLAYMAPEQLKGEKVDRRADLWAAGVVLYELATGQRPFEGKTKTALADEILHAPAPSPQALQPKLSVRLADLILKCLEKDADNRYQSAKELAVDLRRLMGLSAAPVVRLAPQPTRKRTAALLSAVGAVVLLGSFWGLNLGGIRERLLGQPTSLRIRSLAVLPLENLSRDTDQDYFADGMTEELIADLSQISALRVISRTSVMQYKNVRRSLRDIGKELNVDAVVEGSVERSGGRVRISAQLIHAPTDTHLWAKSYQRDLGDVLALQDEVAGAIAHEIRIKLTPSEQARLKTSRAVDPEAHEAYLKGLYHMSKRNEKDLEESITYFQQAIERDPGYALAYAGLADSYSLRGTLLYIVLPPKEVMPKSKAAALRALQIDDSLGEPYATLANVETLYDWEWTKSEEDFKRAIELNPNYAQAHHWYALHLAAMGRHDESISEMRRAQELDPLSLIINTNVGWMLYFAGRYDAAIEQFRQVLELDADFFVAHWELGLAYEQKGMYAEARAEFQKARMLSPNNPVILGSLGEAYALSGRRHEAREILNQLTQLSKQQFVSPYLIAVLNVGLGANDQAFQWLEMAYEQRDNGLIFLKVDPRLRTIRSDPRFQDLLRRVGLSKY